MLWRLGLDVGTSSVGWAAVLLAGDEAAKFIPVGIHDSGVRIFSNGRHPKSNESNAVTRRIARGARRNRDRTLNRNARLMNELERFGLMPGDKAARKALEGGKNIDLIDTDPWILRARALGEKISLHQLGRAIYHLNQRRGFQSNRKTDNADGEKGVIYDAIARTKLRLQQEGAETFGELFGRRRLETYRANKDRAKGEREAQPLARVRKSGAGAKLQYDYYPTRALILDEFDLLWQAQSAFHADALSAAAYDTIRETLAFQHPLKAQPVGKCTLIPTEPRAPKALPSAQYARIYQELNSLRILKAGGKERLITREQRDDLAESLLNPTNQKGNRTFVQLGKILNLASDESFNLESAKRIALFGDLTAARLMHKDRWGKAWFALQLPEQDAIVQMLLNEENEDTLIAYLCTEHGFSEEQAKNIANCPLIPGHGSLSAAAINRILPHLIAEVNVYSEACHLAGFHHSQLGTGEVFDRLPYYGVALEQSVAFGTGEQKHIEEKRVGKIANPTVHAALNQIRLLVNDLIARFGRPEQIVVEVARDLPLSAEGKRELDKLQAENTRANEKRAERLEKVYLQRNTYQNRLRLRLYEEMEALGKCCVFSGQQICAENLFSERVEIEHLLPFARTMDDSFANKTLVMREANRFKNNRPPHEAFARSPEDYDWEAIAARAAEFPPNKRWRFAADAMARFENEEHDFEARQLNDTRYIARMAQEYLSVLYGGQGYAGSKNPVWVVTGRLTADLRHQWGLNSVLLGDNLSEEERKEQAKNRDDHRHHAIDAVVIACTDPALIKRAAAEAKKNAALYNNRLLHDIATPWQSFREDVKDVVRSITISHKPDHGYQGAMLEDTAFGILKGEDGEPGKDGKRGIVTRKPLSAIENTKNLQKVRDPVIRQALINATAGLSGKDFTAALVQAGKNMTPPVYKVRFADRGAVVPIADKVGNLYKAYRGGSNYCCDIWCDAKGKWQGEIITTYQAYQFARKDQNWWRKKIGLQGQNLLMRIRKGDMLELDFEGRRAIVQVYKMGGGRVFYAEHHQTNVAARSNATTRIGKIPKDQWLKETSQSPKGLQSLNAKFVTVSPSGMVTTNG